MGTGGSGQEAVDVHPRPEPFATDHLAEPFPRYGLVPVVREVIITARDCEARMTVTGSYRKGTAFGTSLGWSCLKIIRINKWCVYSEEQE